MTNIRDYHQFRMESPNEIYRRHLDCKCDACLSFNWDGCVNKEICGDWELYPMTLFTTDPIWLNSA